MPRGNTSKNFTGIYVENFKAFGPSGTTIPLGKLTLIYGPNSGGKSSVLKAIASLGQTRLKKKQDPGFNLDWTPDGPWFDLGNSFQVLHDGGNPSKFKIGFESEYINTNAAWIKKKGTNETWKHPEGELVSKGKATQTWRWELPADVPINGCIKLRLGAGIDTEWIIHSALHPTEEELLKFNRQTMDSQYDLTPDMVNIEGRVVTVRVNSDQIETEPSLSLKRSITVKSRLVYVYEFVKGFSKRIILSGIEYYEYREGKMQLIFSGEAVEEAVPAWIRGDRSNLHSNYSNEGYRQESWFPPYMRNHSFMKIKWDKDSDCLVYPGRKSGNFEETKISMADNAMFLKMMGAYVEEEGQRKDSSEEGMQGEFGGRKNLPRRVWRQMNNIENRLWDEMVDKHPNPSRARDKGWDKLWPRLHDEMVAEIEMWNINITPRMKEMLKRIIVKKKKDNFARGKEYFWPSRLFRYWASVALHLKDGKHLFPNDWESRNLCKTISQLAKTPLLEYKDDLTFGVANWSICVPGDYGRMQEDFIELSQEIQRFVDGMDYLTGARMSPARLYSTDGSHSSIGVRGQRSVANLAEKFRYNDKLLAKFNEKLFKVVKMHIGFGDVIATFQQMENLVDIRVGRPEDDIKLLQLPDVGFGVSQVLPLIASTFYDNQTLLVEEAESNLHPAAQAELMDVLLNSILEAGILGPSLILETHSEHFLLAVKNHLRREGGLSDDDVAIIYVENESEESGSMATRINTRDGEFTIPWPRDTWGDPTNPII